MQEVGILATTIRSIRVPVSSVGISISPVRILVRSIRIFWWFQWFRWFRRRLEQWLSHFGGACAIAAIGLPRCGGAVGWWHGDTVAVFAGHFRSFPALLCG
jgi:hypothetical protein